MCQQNASYLVKELESGEAKFALEIVQIALKWPLQCENFQTFSRGA